MADHLPVMVLAIIIAVAVMMAAASPISNFGDRHPTIKMLALSFEDYEREVRTVLDGLLGPAGFDVNKDRVVIRRI